MNDLGIDLDIKTNTDELQLAELALPEKSYDQYVSITAHILDPSMIRGQQKPGGKLVKPTGINQLIDHPESLEMLGPAAIRTVYGAMPPAEFEIVRIGGPCLVYTGDWGQVDQVISQSKEHGVEGIIQNLGEWYALNYPRIDIIVDGMLGSGIVLLEDEPYARIIAHKIALALGGCANDYYESCIKLTRQWCTALLTSMQSWLTYLHGDSVDLKPWYYSDHEDILQKYSKQFAGKTQQYAEEDPRLNIILAYTGYFRQILLETGFITSSQVVLDGEIRDHFDLSGSFGNLTRSIVYGDFFRRNPYGKTGINETFFVQAIYETFAANDKQVLPSRTLSVDSVTSRKTALARLHQAQLWVDSGKVREIIFLRHNSIILDAVSLLVHDSLCLHALYNLVTIEQQVRELKNEKTSEWKTSGKPTEDEIIRRRVEIQELPIKFEDEILQNFVIILDNIRDAYQAIGLF